MYHLHVPLAQIAGSSEATIRWVYFRERDEHCRLVRPGRRAVEDGEYVEPEDRIAEAVGFKEMFYSHKRAAAQRLVGTLVQGKIFKLPTEEQLDMLWQGYLEQNPGLAQSYVRN